MVRLLSSPAMQTIQHYNLLFYWYTDIRVWGKRASIDHIRILPFQLYSSSLLFFGGFLEQNWGATMSQVPSWRRLAEMMLISGSILQGRASRAPWTWCSLWAHAGAELHLMVVMVVWASDRLPPCDNYSGDWLQVGAGRSDADVHTDLILTAPLLFTPLCVPALSGSLLFIAWIHHYQDSRYVLAQKLAQRGPVLSGHLDWTVARTRSFTKALNRTIASCNSLNKEGSLNFLDLNHLIILKSYSEMQKWWGKSRPVHDA